LSANKFRPHVLVLPEDDANRELANGFHLQIGAQRQMQVLPVAGGREEVLKRFKSDHVVEMERFSKRLMVLLIDFDGTEKWLDGAKADAIPEHLSDRVFIIGALSTPEDLKKALGATFETIGSKMADDCRDGTDAIWGHDLLRHNETEIERLRRLVRPVLF
jgi:hypothetical protein